MKFVSLFSGIDAASVAWNPLGWQAVAFSEIEPFPCAVLANHYPDVPNLGDITKINTIRPYRPDVVVAGFPCQDLSVAGKRTGLHHDDGQRTRSGLFFDALRLADDCRSRWLVMENVPGLLSSNDGRDFAGVAGEMAGVRLDVPPDGWRDAGVVAGPKGLVEWRVLDAQFFGLAQRRARVFLVRDSGNWRNRPPVLLEPEGVCGNPPPSRAAGSSVANCVTAGIGGGRGGVDNNDAQGGHLVPETAYCLPAQHKKIGQGHNTTYIPERSHCLNAGGMGRQDYETETLVTHAVDLQNCTLGGAICGTLDTTRPSRGGGQAVITHSLTAEGFDASEDGTGRGTPLVPVHSICMASDPIHARNLAMPITKRHGDPGTVSVGMAVRRLLPTECEALQGFPRNYTQVPYRNKPASDGPRYAALGNSMAVPVMHWIGRRIDKLERVGGSVKGATT